jgi:hypothetical protein
MKLFINFGLPISAHNLVKKKRTSSIGEGKQAAASMTLGSEINVLTTSYSACLSDQHGVSQ